MSRRAIVLVMDGCGAGAAPDAAAFGDAHKPSTIQHVWEAAGGLDAPNLAQCGFFQACGIEEDSSLQLSSQTKGIGSEGSALSDPILGSNRGEPSDFLSSSEALDNIVQQPRDYRVYAPKGGISSTKCARWGRLRELSMGKDSVTGHWEMMGILTEKPFPTYPDGFPEELLHAFEQRIGTKTLGNKPASGTQIIAELGQEHLRTGYPIVYTSADSVFQIACHEELVPIDKLYEMCQIARELCVEPHDLQRVIARPFLGSEEKGFTRTERRKDFPLTPPQNLVDQAGDVFGIGVIPELFGGRGFRPVRRTQSNAEHAKMLFEEALPSDARFIFVNFEDFDMLYGHRSDPAGFARCLEAFDHTLGTLLSRLAEEDLLILTADHGNDPTDSSTDHTREYVPVCVIQKGLESGELGDIDGMQAVGATVASYLGLTWRGPQASDLITKKTLAGSFLGGGVQG